MKKKLFLLIAMMFVLLTVCGCSNSTALDDLKENDAAHEITYGTKDDSLHYGVFSINPKVLIGYDDHFEIKYVEAYNNDAYEVLTKMIAEDESVFENIETFSESFMRTMIDLGYGDAEHCDITFISVGDDSSLEGDVHDMILNAVPADVINVDNVHVSVNRLDDGQICSTCGGSGIETCKSCDGSGKITCTACNGVGTITRTEIGVEEVYNGYVCPVCGGAGVIDDGMHGGETAPCGYCQSGEYRELAYDEVEVEETITDACNTCGGSGQMTCSQCNGAGQHDCSTCGGSGIIW